jgi:hypothetical protein
MSNSKENKNNSNNKYTIDSNRSKDIEESAEGNLSNANGLHNGTSPVIEDQAEVMFC